VTTTDAASFSVGFSLQSSYGYAASNFQDEKLIAKPKFTGQLPLSARMTRQSAFTIYGDEPYGEVMSRLSLDSSVHLA
jgi:hypothetical protein